MLFRFGGLAVLTLLLFFAVTYFLWLRNTSLRAHKQLADTGEQIERELEGGNRAYAQMVSLYPFALLKTGKVIFATDDFDRALLRQHAGKAFYFPIVGDGAALYRYHPGDRDLVETIAVSLPHADTMSERVLTGMLVVLPLVLALMLVIIYGTIRAILIPIRQLNRDVERIDIDRFDRSLAQPKHPDEIARLTKSFNRMIARLHAGVERLKRESDHLAHEIKTPLTVMRAEIELALERPRSREHYQESLRVLLHQITRLERMTHAMLFLARYSRETIVRTFESCDCNALLMDTMDACTPLADARNIRLRFGRFERAKHATNPLLIGMIFTNLLENAIKYSPEKTYITLDLFTEDGQVVCTVQDEGIGIAAEDLPKITERFFKKTQGDEGSFGLGLSIVQESLELLDGRMEIASRVGEGTRVEVRF